jgi:hypothetical protein
MNANVVLPLASALLSLVFAIMLVDQWRERRRPYQLIWAAGMLWYGLSAGAEFLGSAIGWSDPLYRAWYLFGAICVAAWLGLGTASLLSKTRFGYAFAISLLLAGLFTYLTQSRYKYEDSGIAPALYFGIALVLAIATAVLTYRGDERWSRLAGVAVVGGSIAAAVMVGTVGLPSPGYALNAANGIPVGDLLPGYLRLLTPFFNVTGGLALVFGGIYSAYVFMPKRRVIRYSIQRGQPAGAFVRNLVVAPVAIAVNLIASLPGAASDLVGGRLNSRVPATILIALGGFIPSITSGLNRFGDTSAFFVGELLGVAFLFAGFLVSIEVFNEIRIPFTHRVLRARRVQA